MMLFCVAWCAAEGQDTNAPSQPPAQQDVPKPARANTLNVIVTDHRHHPVTNLNAQNFKVYEGEQLQQIATVSTFQNSTCLGLAIDNSGSMRRKHPLVARAMMDLINAGNAEGQTFVVNFNDNPFLDQDFTNDFGRIRWALNHGEPRGGTALYDAVIASTDHLAGTAECEKRALVIVTDGDDNASKKTLPQAMDAVQEANGPVVYVIGLPSDQHPQTSAAKKSLEKLAASTGGEAFFSGNLRDLGTIVEKIAEEIRGQYSIRYVPAIPAQDGSFHPIKVEAATAEHKDMTVRVKTGYFARWASNTTLPPAATATRALVIQQIERPNFNCITGTVVDDHNTPVPGITVRAIPGDRNLPRPFPSTRSDMNGKFRLANLQPGAYELSTINLRDGYPPTSMLLYGAGRAVGVTVPASEGCNDVVVSAGPRAAHLMINAVDARTQLRLTRIIVVLRRDDTPGISYSIPTDFERGVLLPPLTKLIVEVQAPGYDRGDPMPFTSGASDTVQQINVELQPSTQK